MVTELLTRIFKPAQYREAQARFKARITDIETLTNMHPLQIEYDVTQAARQSHMTRYQCAFHVQGLLLQGYTYKAAVAAVKHGYTSGFRSVEQMP